MGARLQDWLAEVQDRPVPACTLAADDEPLDDEEGAPARVDGVGDAGEEPARQGIASPAAMRALGEDRHGVFRLDKPFSADDTPFGVPDLWKPSVQADLGAWREAHPAGDARGSWLGSKGLSAADTDGWNS